MSSATALSWFVRHEVRLAWREWLAMLTGGPVLSDQRPHAADVPGQVEPIK